MTKKSFINTHNISQLCDALLPKLGRALEKSRGEEIELIPHALSHQNAAQIVRRIYNEFHNEDILQNKFNGNFDEFFDYLLFWSYGLKFSPENNKPCFKSATVEERQFVGKVDLFCLVNSLLNNYPQKYRHSPEGYYDDFRLENIVSTSQGKLTLRASFSDYLWDNIFNDYDTYLGTDNKEICLFNRAVHAVASFIHTANPHAHYLHFTSEHTKNPLATAILFEGSGRSTAEGPFLDYLVVEGVLGNFSESATKQDKETLYGFLWDSIKKYAHNKGIKRIFVNTSHSGNQIEPEEFVEYVFKTENITEEQKLKGGIVRDKFGLSHFQLQIPEKVLKKRGNNYFTHEFQLKVSPESNAYANKSSNGDVYHDERYADLFYRWNEKEAKKWEKGSFFVPKGYAQGFEVGCPDGSSGTLERITKKNPTTLKLRERIIRFNILAGILGGLISSGIITYSIFAIFSAKESDLLNIILHTGLSGIGVGIFRASREDLLRTIPINRDYKWGLGCPPPGQFYYLEGCFTSQATIVEKEFGRLVEPMSSLKELEWYPHREKNHPYRFLDHLILKEVTLPQHQTAREKLSDDTCKGIDKIITGYTSGSFLVERFSEKRRIDFHFPGSIPADFSKLLEQKDKEIALLYSPPQYDKNDETKYPLNVVRIYPHSEL